MEPMSAEPTPGSNYDFIMNPQRPQKRGLIRLGGDSFVAKIVFIVGGAVFLMVVLALVVNLFFGGRTNLETIVGIAQSEQEIVRLGALGGDASTQEIKNAAINTQLSIKSHQQDWLTFLGQRDREVKTEELSLKKDSSNDKKLDTARQTSSFDATYGGVMRSELEDYAASLRSAYQGASNKQERGLLNSQYQDVQLLLKQWPAPTLGLAAY